MSKLALRHFLISSQWDICGCSRVANSIDKGQIRPEFELIQAFMEVIITCKYEKDQIKNSQQKLQYVKDK